MRGVLAAVLVLGLGVSAELAAQSAKMQLEPVSMPHLSGVSPVEGKLRVWIVAPYQPPKAAELPRTLRQQTAGSFGQSAGTYGQTAGSYGQPTGSVSRQAGSNGDKTAGDTGQTAGSFGNSLDTLAAVAGPAQADKPVPSKVVRDPRWAAVTREMERALAKVQITFEDVSANDVERRLKEAQRHPELLPDFFLGLASAGALGFADANMVRPIGLTSWATTFALRAAPDLSVPIAEEAAIYLAGQNRRPAEAASVWLWDRSLCIECGEFKLPDDTVADPDRRARALKVMTVAKAAMKSVLSAATATRVDPEAAEVNPVAAQGEAFAPSGPADADVRLLTEVTALAANDTLAVVTLRTVAEGKSAFGVIRSMVVLRKVNGAWHVLQVTPAVPFAERSEWGAIASCTGRPRPEGDALPSVSLPAPPDGDNRQAEPQMSWDNNGLAKVQVVEWQRGDGSSTRLMPITDTDPRPKTQVTARFARADGPYGWRVWSVRSDGVMTITKWRHFTVVGR
jgi:hypothetical protein